MKTIKFMSVREFAIQNNIVDITCYPKRIKYTDRETKEDKVKTGYYFRVLNGKGEVAYYGTSFNFTPEKEIQVKINDELEYPIQFVNNSSINFNHLL